MPILIKGGGQVMQTVRSQAHTRIVQDWADQFRTAKRRPLERPPLLFQSFRGGEAEPGISRSRVRCCASPRD